MQIHKLTTAMESQTASARAVIRLNCPRRLRTPSALWPLSTRWGLQRVVFFFSRSNFNNWLRRATFLSVAGTASLVLRAWVCETKFRLPRNPLHNPRLAWGYRRPFAKSPFCLGASAYIANRLKQKPPFRLRGIGMQH